MNLKKWRYEIDGEQKLSFKKMEKNILQCYISHPLMKKNKTPPHKDINIQEENEKRCQLTEFGMTSVTLIELITSS